jgi:hypothetical protein
MTTDTYPRTLLDCEHAVLTAVLERWVTHEQLPQLEDRHFTPGCSRAIWRASRTVPTPELAAHLEQPGRLNLTPRDPTVSLVIDQLLLCPTLPLPRVQAAAQRLIDHYDAQQLQRACEAVAATLRAGLSTVGEARAALLEVL